MSWLQHCVSLQLQYVRRLSRALAGYDSRGSVNPAWREGKHLPYPQNATWAQCLPPCDVLVCVFEMAVWDSGHACPAVGPGKHTLSSSRSLWYTRSLQACCSQEHGRGMSLVPGDLKGGGF